MKRKIPHKSATNKRELKDQKIIIQFQRYYIIKQQHKHKLEIEAAVFYLPCDRSRNIGTVIYPQNIMKKTMIDTNLTNKTTRKNKPQTKGNLNIDKQH